MLNAPFSHSLLVSLVFALGLSFASSTFAVQYDDQAPPMRRVSYKGKLYKKALNQAYRDIAQGKSGGWVSSRDAADHLPQGDPVRTQVLKKSRW